MQEIESKRLLSSKNILLPPIYCTKYIILTMSRNMVGTQSHMYVSTCGPWVRDIKHIDWIRMDVRIDKERGRELTTRAT